MIEEFSSSPFSPPPNPYLCFEWFQVALHLLLWIIAWRLWKKRHPIKAQGAINFLYAHYTWSVRWLAFRTSVALRLASDNESTRQQDYWTMGQQDKGTTGEQDKKTKRQNDNRSKGQEVIRSLGQLDNGTTGQRAVHGHWTDFGLRWISFRFLETFKKRDGSEVQVQIFSKC